MKRRQTPSMPRGMAVMKDSTETERLLRLVRDGETEAFNRLFTRHRKYLKEAIELRMEQNLRRRLDPSDVVQETQLEAFRRIDDYLQRQPMPFRLWLRKTAYERLGKLREQHVGAARRSVLHEVPLPDHSSVRLADQLVGRGSSPSQKVSRKEIAAKVRQALSRLREPDREILTMRYVEQLSNQEVAYLLELDPATVSKRHGRAVLRLQKILADLGFEGSH